MCAIDVVAVTRSVLTNSAATQVDSVRTMEAVISILLLAGCGR